MAVKVKYGVLTMKMIFDPRRVSTKANIKFSQHLETTTYRFCYYTRRSTFEFHLQPIKDKTSDAVMLKKGDVQNHALFEFKIKIDEIGQKGDNPKSLTINKNDGGLPSPSRTNKNPFPSFRENRDV